MRNLLRVSKISEQDFPISPSTLYKWRHTNKYPELFIKLGGFLFIDLSELDRLCQTNRLSKKERGGCDV